MVCADSETAVRLAGAALTLGRMEIIEPLPRLHQVNLVDRAALLDSYRMLADLDPSTLCVGHGDSVVADAGVAMRAADVH